jgi:hypothetical protein
MVPVEVRNEDMIDTPQFEVEFPELNLGALPAINQEELFIESHNLSGRKPVRGWQS